MDAGSDSSTNSAQNPNQYAMNNFTNQLSPNRPVNTTPDRTSAPETGVRVDF